MVFHCSRCERSEFGWESGTLGGVTSQKNVPCVENCCAAFAPKAVTQTEVHETCTDWHGPVQMRRLLLVLG